jgi:hypothetical protein
MTEQEAMRVMVAPGTRRPGKYREGVIQIHVTRACDRACYACTQGSNLGGKTHMISPADFEAAVVSLRGYFGVVGVFGGNPALHPQFPELCRILREHVPYEQRGLWCNDPVKEEHGRAMAATFNPSVSNLNVHMSADAHGRFRRWWPQAHPVGLQKDSRHSPVHLAMTDLDVLPANPGKDQRYLTKVPNTEENRWNLIADCDINRHWSAMVAAVRGEVRGFFCEVAGAQAILHEDDPDWPETGVDVTQEYCVSYSPGHDEGVAWWQLPMASFAADARWHCHRCAVPLRGYGELACAPDANGEQTSPAHANVFKSKRPARPVQVTTSLVQLGVGRITRTTHYLQNSGK